MTIKIANTELTPVGDILGQMLEKRPLPQGIEEFEEWSDRILSGALVKADTVSLKHALANMVLHLGPTESHKEDAYFIHTLRKTAANQIALAKIDEYKKVFKEKLEQEKAELEKSQPDQQQPSA